MIFYWVFTFTRQREKSLNRMMKSYNVTLFWSRIDVSWERNENISPKVLSKYLWKWEEKAVERVGGKTCSWIQISSKSPPFALGNFLKRKSLFLFSPFMFEVRFEKILKPNPRKLLIILEKSGIMDKKWWKCFRLHLKLRKMIYLQQSAPWEVENNSSFN